MFVFAILPIDFSGLEKSHGFTTGIGTCRGDGYKFWCISESALTEPHF